MPMFTVIYCPLGELNQLPHYASFNGDVSHTEKWENKVLPHRRVPLGTVGNTGRTQSTAHGKVPRYCSLSSQPGQSHSCSAHTWHWPEHWPCC